MPAKIEAGTDYDKARIRKVLADAQLVEVNLAQARGELCSTQAVIEAWQQVLKAFTTRIEAIPAKLAPMLANETNPAAVKILLEDATKEALEELANYRPQIDPVATTLLTAHEMPPIEPETPKRGRGRPSKIQKAKEGAAKARQRKPAAKKAPAKKPARTKKAAN